MRTAPGLEIERLAALLTGGTTQWSAFQTSPEELLEAGVRHDLTSLMHWRVSSLPKESGWPEALRTSLAVHTLSEAAQELQRARETRCVVDALATEDIHPIFFKGAALAYVIYDAPALRPRRDTDVFIRRDQVDAIRNVMVRLGYSASTMCDGELLFCQFELSRTDEFGVCHAFDFHWKISTQPLFAEVLTYDELFADAQPLAAFGTEARAAGLIHSLLLACVHPVMHHRNLERLLWIFDIHLMASRLTNAEFDRFADLTLEKKMAAIVNHQLTLCQTTFGTAIPGIVITKLSSPGHEPSAEYLRPGRHWHDELASSIRSLSTINDRARLLREVLFPSPSYMLAAYGLRAKPLARLFLPALYMHRNIRGAWNVVFGKK